MEDIEHYGIPVYNFPYDVEEDDEDTIADNSELRVRTPLSTVAALTIPNHCRCVGPIAVRHHWL